MFKNTLLKVLTISILISSLFLNSCTTEEKTITVQDDMQKMSNELDEDGRIFTKISDITIPETEISSIKSSPFTPSPPFFDSFIIFSSDDYKNSFSLNSDNFISSIASNSAKFKGINKGILTYFNDTELWIYNSDTKQNQFLINIPDIKEESKNATSINPLKISGDNNYLSILSLIQYDGYHENIIRIFDLKTGELHKSVPLKDLYLSQNILYSKITDKFYTSTPYSENILEFSIADMNPKEIIHIPGIKVENFKMSEDGKCIYFTQKDRDSKELSFSKLDLQTKNITTLLKISPKEKDEDLFWNNFDIVGTTLVYALFTNISPNFEASLTKQKLYAANIIEDSIADNQLLYSSPNAGNSSVWFYLDKNGNKLFSSIAIYPPPESGESTEYPKSVQYSLYEKTK